MHRRLPAALATSIHHQMRVMKRKKRKRYTRSELAKQITVKVNADRTKYLRLRVSLK
jgi:hypothetical protein